ncbi:hypothetical protein DL98DRAFT_536476 [Cadophora sp. DSE1049]|nr:hypothetical protein DL98DRAFT_536476 [Cadophora sp. DSE1049]
MVILLATLRLLSWVGKCPICYSRKRAGYDVDTHHKLELCKDEKREVVATEIEKLQGIEFAEGVCCKLCAVPQETCEDSMYFSQEEEKCLYDGVVREAVAAMMVVGPDAVVDKMYAWMRSEGIWAENTALSEEEAQQVTRMMLEWFSRKASWRHYTASVLVQVFNQLDRWVGAFGKGVELEDWFRLD